MARNCCPLYRCESMGIHLNGNVDYHTKGLDLNYGFRDGDLTSMMCGAVATLLCSVDSNTCRVGKTQSIKLLYHAVRFLVKAL